MVCWGKLEVHGLMIFKVLSILFNSVLKSMKWVHSGAKLCWIFVGVFCKVCVQGSSNEWSQLWYQSIYFLQLYIFLYYIDAYFFRIVTEEMYSTHKILY